MTVRFPTDQSITSPKSAFDPKGELRQTPIILVHKRPTANPTRLLGNRAHERRDYMLQRDTSVMRGRELLRIDVRGFVRKVANAVWNGRDINEWRIPFGANDPVRRFNRGYIRGSGLLCLRDGVGINIAVRRSGWNIDRADPDCIGCDDEAKYTCRTVLWRDHFGIDSHQSFLIGSHA